jgi:hypothetical protein
MDCIRLAQDWQAVGCCECSSEPTGSRFHTVQRICWLAEELVALQEELSSMELVNYNLADDYTVL